MKLSFTPKGHCLISKQTGIQIAEKLKGIKYPQRAKSYDVVEIGHKFKPEEYNTRIITFRDKNGKIVQRNITENTPNATIDIRRNYIDYGKTLIEDPKNVYRDVEIQGRKISTVTKKDGVFFSKSEEIQTRTLNTPQPIVNISQIESTPTGYSGIEKEKQSLYEYRKGHRHGYSVENIIRNNHSGVFKLGDFKAEFENMKDSPINDRYFLFHLYPLKHFKRVAPYTIENPAHTPPLTHIKWYNQHPEKDAETASFGFFDGDVNLNNKTLNTKIEVIKTTAHEKEHAYQKAERNKPIELHTEETKKNIDAHQNYIAPEKDFEKYKANHNEIRAKEAERNAVDEYMKSSDDLKLKFPYAADYQIGFSYVDEARYYR